MRAGRPQHHVNPAASSTSPRKGEQREPSPVGQGEGHGRREESGKQRRRTRRCKRGRKQERLRKEDGESRATLLKECLIRYGLDRLEPVEPASPFIPISEFREPAHVRALFEVSRKKNSGRNDDGGGGLDLPGGACFLTSAGRVFTGSGTCRGGWRDLAGWREMATCRQEEWRVLLEGCCGEADTLARYDGKHLVLGFSHDKYSDQRRPYSVSAAARIRPPDLEAAAAGALEQMEAFRTRLLPLVAELTSAETAVETVLSMTWIE